MENRQKGQKRGFLKDPFFDPFCAHHFWDPVFDPFFSGRAGRFPKSAYFRTKKRTFWLRFPKPSKSGPFLDPQKWPIARNRCFKSTFWRGSQKWPKMTQKGAFLDILAILVIFDYFAFFRRQSGTCFIIRLIFIGNTLFNMHPKSLRIFVRFWPFWYILDKIAVFGQKSENR